MKRIKSILTALGICLVISFPLHAQRLITHTDTVVLQSCEIFPNSIDTIRLYNNSDADIMLRWQRPPAYHPHGGNSWLILDPCQYLPNYQSGFCKIVARDTTDVIFYLTNEMLLPGEVSYMQLHIYDYNDSTDASVYLIAIQECPLQTSLSAPSLSSSIRVVPNPVRDFATIQLPDGPDGMALQIMSSAGNVVRNIKVRGSELQFSREALPAGVYFIVLQRDGYPSEMSRMIILD